MNLDGATSAAATVVRRATDGDRNAIIELNRLNNGEDAAVEITSAFGAGHIAPSDFAVAAAGEPRCLHCRPSPEGAQGRRRASPDWPARVHRHRPGISWPGSRPAVARPGPRLVGRPW